MESLSVSRKAAMSGTEPSDGMRVVNALLTQVQVDQMSTGIVNLQFGGNIKCVISRLTS